MYSRVIQEHCIVIQVIENLSKCSSCDTCGALCTLLNQLHNRLNQAEKEIVELESQRTRYWSCIKTLCHQDV